MSKAPSRAAARSAVLAAVVLGACSPKTAAADTPARSRLVEIIATEFHLDPDRIMAEPGETLTLSLRNEGAVVHSLAVDLGSAGIARLPATVKPHETAEMTITVPASPGDFAYYCPIDGHRALGMAGMLSVMAAPVVRLDVASSRPVGVHSAIGAAPFQACTSYVTRMPIRPNDGTLPEMTGLPCDAPRATL